ncbi:MAG: hypothetical protein NWF04_06110 [Candidatus Bathyarchaeota archaeon]|nr:hypothetical protein [Candidatus Bathyarchaeota archaeon]
MSFNGSEFLIIESIFSGVAVAAAFPVGALIAIYLDYSRSTRALFAAFGAGIFLSTVMLLVQHALELGTILDLTAGFIVGAVAYGVAEHHIRHKSGIKDETDEEQKQKRLQKGTGRLSIVGTILDSVPETLFVGIIIALKEPGLFAAEAVLFLGNLATVLEAAKIMKKAGMQKRKILRDWMIDFGIVAVAAPLGYFLATAVIKDVLASVLGFAAGTLIVFISGQLIARAYRESKGHAEDTAISIGFIIGIILLFAV